MAGAGAHVRAAEVPAVGVVGSVRRAGRDLGKCPSALAFLAQQNENVCAGTRTDSRMASTKTTKGTRLDGDSPKRRGAGTAAARRSRADAKISKTPITRAIAEEFGLTYEETEAIWDFLLSRMRRALAAPGGSIIFRNIGTLTTYERNPREYRNPATGEMYPSRTDLTVRFHTSHNLWEQPC